MSQSTKVFTYLATALLASFLGACRYGSFYDAQNACGKWKLERKGTIEVDFDGDGAMGSGAKSFSASDNLVDVRECIHAKGMGHIIGRELITPWKAFMTEMEYSKIKIKYREFWFN